jgi:hypothetical protein
MTPRLPIGVRQGGVGFSKTVLLTSYWSPKSDLTPSHTAMLVHIATQIRVNRQHFYEKTSFKKLVELLQNHFEECAH